MSDIRRSATVVGIQSAMQGLADAPPCVAAVIILYYPDRSLLDRLLRSLVGQVQSIIMVDNTPEASADISGHIETYNSRVSYVALNDNFGIAAAQNIGIRDGLKNGHSHILLLDQDSCLAPDMVDQLLAAEYELISAGKKVAAVGPLFVDEKTGRYSFAIRPGIFGVRRISIQPNSAAVVETDHLIASGSLINAASFQAIGLMRDELFIDWVDIEWGLRARKMGFISYIVPNVIMRHSIGDSTVRFMGRDIYIHNDTRNYYMVRNATYLLRSGFVRGWHWTALSKIIKYVIFYSVCSKDPRKSSKLLLTAVAHGLRGRLGRLT